MNINKIIIISGTVQGIGFRPAVYKIAKKLNIFGKIYNSSVGVKIEISITSCCNFEKFINEIKLLKLPGMKIDNLKIVESDSKKNYNDFTISEPEKDINGIAEYPPDSRICNACLEDLKAKDTPRYMYPLVACTHCGPRFTVIEQLPYDRNYTTIKYLERCDACENDYVDPNSRRFNFETDSCWRCAPWFGFINFKSHTYCKLDNICHTNMEDMLIKNGYICSKIVPCDGYGMNSLIKKANAHVLNGDILALKGIGGYQLIVDARNADAVTKLRNRKNRKNKPLAVMLKDENMLHEYCKANRKQIELLKSRVAPIVLIEQKNSDIAYNVTMGTRNLGVMLPYSPIHSILVDFPVVATSANNSGSPIIFEDLEIIEKISLLADCAIVHDRPITMGIDDSLVSCSSKEDLIIMRYARGFVPESYNVFDHEKSILALGSDLKNTFSLSKKNKIYLSQYNGDLKNGENEERYLSNINHFKKVFNIQPEILVVDMHPEYVSRKLGIERSKLENLKLYEVQHHFAHALSVMAENNFTDPCISIVLDGTGFGTDGKIWGGEILFVTTNSFKRLSHLDYINLIGGEKAVKEPYRQLASVEHHINKLFSEFLNVKFSDSSVGKKCLNNENYGKNKANLLKMLSNRINTIPTSSAGRLFDLASTILLGIEKYEFESEAAIKFEDAAKQFIDCKGTNYLELCNLISKSEIYKQANRDDSLNRMLQNKYRKDWLNNLISIGMSLGKQSIIQSINTLAYSAMLLERYGNCNFAAFSFHALLAGAICNSTISNCNFYNIKNCIISGGVFQNELLKTIIVKVLKLFDINVLENKKTPCNDENISLGQAYYAICKQNNNGGKN